MEGGQNPSNSISCECTTQKNAPVDFLGDSTCGKVAHIVRQFNSVIATDSKRQSFQSLSSKPSNHESLKKISNINSSGSNTGNLNLDAGYSCEQLSYDQRFKKGQSENAEKSENIEKESLINQHQSSTGTLEPKRSFIVLNKESEYENNSISKNPLPLSYQSKTTIAKTPSGVRIITDIYFDNNGRPVDDIIGSHVETVIPPSKILAEFQQKSASAGN